MLRVFKTILLSESPDIELIQLAQSFRRFYTMRIVVL